MITFIPPKDSGLIIKTPSRRREDVETNEDKEVAFARTQLQEIKIICFMNLRNGTLAMKAILSLKWDVEVKAVEDLHQNQNQNQNRSERVGDTVGDGVEIFKRNIKFREIFRRAINFQMLKMTLSLCKYNRTNKMEEEEVLMKIRCIQYP